MNFRPGLATKVMAGEKTVTRRLVSDNPRSPWWREKCALVVGRDYAVCPGRGKVAIGRVVVRSVRFEELVPEAQLTDEEARREGFADAAEFAREFAAINSPLPRRIEVWRIEFERA